MQVTFNPQYSTPKLNTNNAPSFNVYGGSCFDKQVQNDNMIFPYTSTEIIIKSGTFARVVGRKYF